MSVPSSSGVDDLVELTTPILGWVPALSWGRVSLDTEPVIFGEVLRGELVVLELSINVFSVLVEILTVAAPTFVVSVATDVSRGVMTVVEMVVVAGESVSVVITSTQSVVSSKAVVKMSLSVDT